MGSLLMQRLPSTARDSDWVDVGWAHESVFLTGPQVILTLLVTEMMPEISNDSRHGAK